MQTRSWNTGSRRETEPWVPLGLDKSQKVTAPVLQKLGFLPTPSCDRHALRNRDPVALLKKAEGFHCSGHHLQQPSATSPHPNSPGKVHPSLPASLPEAWASSSEASEGPDSPHPQSHAGSQGPLSSLEAQCGGWQEDPTVRASGRRHSR